MEKQPVDYSGTPPRRVCLFCLGVLLAILIYAVATCSGCASLSPAPAPVNSAPDEFNNLFLRVLKGMSMLIFCLLSASLLSSCGTTAGLTKNGTAFVQTGLLSKIDKAAVKVVVPGGGSITVVQSGYSGTEVANTLAVGGAASNAIKGATAQLHETESTARVTEKFKGQALVKGTRDPNVIPADPNVIPVNPNP